MSKHFFTVDVEEHFHANALEASVPRATWALQQSRVERGLDRILEMLGAAGHRGTFFVLGWVAERHRSLMRRIVAEGHEIASHGSEHRRVTDLTPREFRWSVRRCKNVLEDVVGREVIGYRAPSFSIVPGREWALDVLIEEGFRYDSSLFPIRRPGYGYPGAQRDPYWIFRSSGAILELPPATLHMLGGTIPAGGGAYFRLFPYPLVREALRACERRGVPGMFYIHPWELDPEQPRLTSSVLTRVRHYGGIARTEERLRRLLRDFEFGSVSAALRASPAEQLLEPLAV